MVHGVVISGVVGVSIVVVGVAACVVVVLVAVVVEYWLLYIGW